MKQLFLISGIPGSGKSTFGRYLRDRRGFYFIDMEHDPWPDEEIHAIWNDIWPPLQNGFLDTTETNIKIFVDSLSEKTILDWGFPPYVHILWLLNSLSRCGVRVIWFDCDIKIAKQSYLRREKGENLAAFNQQIERIEKSWKQIESYLKPEMINVLDKDLTYKSMDEIERILQKNVRVKNI